MSKNGTFKNGRSPRTAVKRKPQLRILHYFFVPKYLKNNSFERFAPASLSTTDAFFPWGSLIYPFLYNLSIASQSRPFHALVAYWSCELVRYRSASTISSTLSLSYSIIALSFLHLERWNAKDLVGPFDITFLLIIQFPDGLYLLPELKTIPQTERQLYDLCNSLHYRPEFVLVHMAQSVPGQKRMKNIQDNMIENSPFNFQ